MTTTSPYDSPKCIRRLPVSGGFNAFAILIDFNANANQYVKCYFPEFKTATSMSFNIELKVIYGNSYPPDLTDGKQYGSVYRTTSNTLSFPSGNANMGSLSSLSSGPT